MTKHFLPGFTIVFPSSWPSNLLINNRNVRYKNHHSTHWPNFSDFWKFSLKTLLDQASGFMRQPSQVFPDFRRVGMSPGACETLRHGPHEWKRAPPCPALPAFLQGLEWPSREKKQWKGQLHRRLVRGSVNLYFKVIWDLVKPQNILLPYFSFDLTV